MSFAIQLFISGQTSLEELATEIGQILDITLTKNNDVNGIRYQFSGKEYTIDVFTDHGFENDRDMNFEAYEYAIDISPVRSIIPAAAARPTIETLARRLFDTLKSSHHYGIMLIEDAQKKLEVFDPRSAH